MSKKTAKNAVGAALEQHLGELELVGADLVRSALARELAAAIAEAPPYVKPKIVHELRELLADLDGHGVHRGDGNGGAATKNNDVARMLRAIS